MSSRRRNYRAAKRQVAESPRKGVFVSHKQKQNTVYIALALMILVFLEGFIWGSVIFGKNK